MYVEDLEDIDPDTAKSLLWILENDIGEDLGLTMAYQSECLGQRELIELLPGGQHILVTEENKKEYVKKLAHEKMTGLIRRQSKAFMRGIEKVIPYETLKLFNYKEVALYLSGMPTVDGILLAILSCINEVLCQIHLKYFGSGALCAVVLELFRS